MTRQQQIWLSSACFILLILLTGCVWSGYTNGLDNQVRGFALGLFPPGNERIWSDITFLGSGMVITTLTVLALTILGLQKKWREIRYLIFVVAAAGATEVSMKWLVNRPRPTEVFAHTMPTSFSFPSGHTIYGTTFYLAIAAIGTSWLKQSNQFAVWLVAALLAVLIGASRIFLGVHYFSDVLGGYLVAVFWLTFMGSMAPPKDYSR